MGYRRFLFTLALTAFAIDAGARVVGRDDRKYANFRTKPAKYMGKLDGCTGGLVGEKTVATAGHCLKGRASGTFYLHYDRGDYTAHAYLQSPMDTGSWGDYGHNGGSELTTGNDWAVSTLDRELGKTYGYLGIHSSSPRDGQSITLVGYPADYYGRASEHTQCKVTSAGTKYFYHDCDAGPGCSGSTIVDFLSDDVIGIFTGWSYGSPTATTFNHFYDEYYAIRYGRRPEAWASRRSSSVVTPVSSTSRTNTDDLDLAILRLRLLQLELQQRQQQQPVYTYQPQVQYVPVQYVPVQYYYVQPVQYYYVQPVQYYYVR